jgi:hypothetical protein
VYISDSGGSKNIRGYWYSLSAYEISSVRLSSKYSSVVVTDACHLCLKLNKGEIIVTIITSVSYEVSGVDNYLEK